MRRLLRDIAEGRALGDVTTLADPTVVASLKDSTRKRRESHLRGREEIDKDRHSAEGAKEY